MNYLHFLDRECSTNDSGSTRARLSDQHLNCFVDSISFIDHFTSGGSGANFVDDGSHCPSLRDDCCLCHATGNCC